jgi:hypothetical protein
MASASKAAAIFYRERAKTWRDSAAAVPDGAPQQAVYREIAEGYEKISAHYERQEQLARGSKVQVVPIVAKVVNGTTEQLLAPPHSAATLSARSTEHHT